MTINYRRILSVCLFTVASAVTLLAQTTTPTQNRKPRTAIRDFVVLSAQSLNDLERKLQPSNKVEELIGGEGMELRVAVQHEKNTTPANAELHDDSDDVYYVLAGSATLTLGGTLDNPREAEPGEWRGAAITGGRKIDVKKGDLIIVPRGTPHQRSTANQDFTMVLIKVYAEPRPAPKPVVK